MNVKNLLVCLRSFYLFIFSPFYNPFVFIHLEKIKNKKVWTWERWKDDKRKEGKEEREFDVFKQLNGTWKKKIAKKK